MGKVVRRRWRANLDAGLSRRDRQGCEYEAYVPDPLIGRRFALDGDVAADVADAERAITEVNASAVALADTEALARLLLRAESGPRPPGPWAKRAPTSPQKRFSATSTP
jgi:hypothetical protein